MVLLGFIQLAGFFRTVSPNCPFVWYYLCWRWGWLPPGALVIFSALFIEKRPTLTWCPRHVGWPILYVESHVCTPLTMPACIELGPPSCPVVVLTTALSRTPD